MLALLVAAALAQAQPVREPCRAGDEGRRFATCFDPGRGLELWSAGGARSLKGGLELGVAFRFRGDRDSRSKQGTDWLLQHRVAAVTARLAPDGRGLSATAYELVARRHVGEGFLVLPTSPPARLPFPIDLGLYASVARYERRVEEGFAWRLETARVAMLFDPLRSASGRFHLGFGPSLSHALLHDGAALRHELVPLTALQVFVNAESDGGLWVLRAAGTVGWTFDPAALRAGGVFRARGELQLERVVLAVNDQPVSVQVRAAGALRDAGALQQSEWSVGAGLKLQLFTKR